MFYVAGYMVGHWVRRIVFVAVDFRVSGTCLIRGEFVVAVFALLLDSLGSRLTQQRSLSGTWPSRICRWLPTIFRTEILEVAPLAQR